MQPVPACLPSQAQQRLPACLLALNLRAGTVVARCWLVLALAGHCLLPSCCRRAWLLLPAGWQLLAPVPAAASELTCALVRGWPTGKCSRRQVLHSISQPAGHACIGGGQLTGQWWRAMAADAAAVACTPNGSAGWLAHCCCSRRCTCMQHGAAPPGATALLLPRRQLWYVDADNGLKRVPRCAPAADMIPASAGAPGLTCWCCCCR
jgi:hypothetical protein